MGWNKPARARAKSIGKSIPKGMTVRDLELGYLTKRFSYAFCKTCGYVADGWPSSRRWSRKGTCPECKDGVLKNSWLEINWRVLVDMLGINDKHELPSWYK